MSGMDEEQACIGIREIDAEIICFQALTIVISGSYRQLQVQLSMLLHSKNRFPPAATPKCTSWSNGTSTG